MSKLWHMGVFWDINATIVTKPFTISLKRGFNILKWNKNNWYVNKINTYPIRRLRSHHQNLFYTRSRFYGVQLPQTCQRELKNVQKSAGKKISCNANVWYWYHCGENIQHNNQKGIEENYKNLCKASFERTKPAPPLRCNWLSIKFTSSKTNNIKKLYLK